MTIAFRIFSNSCRSISLGNYYLLHMGQSQFANS